VDYRDCYISPGIVDLNAKTNGDWDGREFTTKAAIAGGVTFFLEEPAWHHVHETEEQLYCDIGLLKVISEGDLDEIEGNPDVLNDYLAFKSYLFRPSRGIEAIHDIDMMTARIAALQKLYIINIL
jgi:hypothetical protein